MSTVPFSSLGEMSGTMFSGLKWPVWAISRAGAHQLGLAEEVAWTHAELAADHSFS